MFLVPINYLAIITCGVVSMIIGFIWYGPLFGKIWMKLVTVTEKKMEEVKKEDMTKTYLVTFLLSLIMAYALAHFIWFTAPGAVTFLIGVKTALWVWFGFVATVKISGFLYNPERKSMDLLLIDSGYYLVNLLVMSLIIVAWPAI